MKDAITSWKRFAAEVEIGLGLGVVLVQFNKEDFWLGWVEFNKEDFCLGRVDFHKGNGSAQQTSI